MPVSTAVAVSPTIVTPVSAIVPADQTSESVTVSDPMPFTTPPVMMNRGIRVESASPGMFRVPAVSSTLPAPAKLKAGVKVCTTEPWRRSTAPDATSIVPLSVEGRCTASTPPPTFTTPVSGQPTSSVKPAGAVTVP